MPRASPMPDANRTPATLATATSTIAAQGHGPGGEAGHDRRGIGPEAGGEGRGEARVHHEQALPAVEERHPGPEGFAQVDVAAAGLGIAGGELAEAQGAAEGRTRP